MPSIYELKKSMKFRKMLQEGIPGSAEPTGINAGQSVHPYTVHKDPDTGEELHFPADPDKDFRNRAKANKKRRIGHEDHKRRTR